MQETLFHFWESCIQKYVGRNFMNSQKIIKYIFEIDHEEIWGHWLSDIWEEADNKVFRKCYWKSINLKGREKNDSLCTGECGETS